MVGVGLSHDISVGAYLLRLSANGYRRRPAPQRGARVAGGDYGWGDLSIWQRWHQFTWVGGIGADKWVDEGMYDFAVGMDTTVADQVSISRALRQSTHTGWAASDYVPRQFLVHSGRLYCVTLQPAGSTVGSSVFRYEDVSDSWVRIKQFGTVWRASSVMSFGGFFCVGFRNGKIRRTKNPATTASWKTTVAPRKVRGKPVTAMKPFGGFLYISYQDVVYRRKANWKVQGKKVFYNPSGASPIVAMEEHLGFLYMGSQNGHIHRTDGNASFDLYHWDGGTRIQALKSFDGRLFVSTYEYEDDPELGVNGIYQFTGAAVTQLKRWGKREKATYGGRFAVHAGRLFYGAPGLWGFNEDVGGTDQGGFGVAVFDPIEDAHSIWATNRNVGAYPDSTGVWRDWVIDDVIFWRGHLHAATRKHGQFRVPETYRDYVDGTVLYDVEEVSPGVWSGTGFLESSVYDGGTPGLAKQWREFVLTAYLPLGCTASLLYSLDGGESWTSGGTVTGSVTRSRRESFLLPPTARSPSFRYRLEMTSDDANNSPVVTGVTVAYLPIPEPNWVWDVAVDVADRVQLLDQTDQSVSTAALVDYFAAAFRTQDVLSFVDIDGRGYDVLLWDLIDDFRVPASAGEQREGILRLTLLEVTNTPVT